MKPLWITAVVIIVLAGCGRLSPAPAWQEAAPVSSPPSPSPAARWIAYNYRPPFYGSEELLMYEDGRCVLKGTEAPADTVCRWTDQGQRRVEFAIVDAGGETATAPGILAETALDGPGAGDGSCYLYVDFGRGRERTFVLEASPDAAMVRTAVAAEEAWNRREIWRSIGKYQQAVNMGSPYARVRLGWMLATIQELLDPGEAVALLEPLQGRDSHYVAEALAAAYAASGDFDMAVEEQVRACRLVDPRSAAYEECLSLLALYRQQEPYLISLNADAVH